MVGRRKVCFEAHFFCGNFRAGSKAISPLGTKGDVFSRSRGVCGGFRWFESCGFGNSVVFVFVVVELVVGCWLLVV